MKRIRTSVLFILSEVIFNLFLSSIFAYTDSNTQQNLKVLAAEVNGRILVNDINDEKVSAIIQINTTSGLEALGGATLVIGFDTSTISIKALPVKNIDYIFHNFCGGNYSSATVTRPMNNCIWINIDLPFQKSNQGTLVAGGNNWTDVVTINFDVVDAHGFTSIYWLPNIVYWGIYDDDNITLWKVGRFQDALNVPLPVELSSFTAKLLDYLVQLDWSTETEINNYGFDVERKVNGANWNKIGFVAGNGNSNSRKYYAFTDNNLTGGNNFYYRLKQIDTDGKFEYSEIIELEYSPRNFALYQNYPNPFNPSTKIKYSLAKSSNVVLKIFDVLGNEVANLVDEYLPAGSYEVEFGSPSFPSGIYLYKLQADSFVDTKKMILIK
jgi:hypothetical protein